MAAMAPVKATRNQAALDQFLKLPVSSAMVSYLADRATGVIRCKQWEHHMDKHLPPTSPITPPQQEDSISPIALSLPPLKVFKQGLVNHSHVRVPTLMTTLICLSRLQQKLPAHAEGIQSTVHRIFLASLILAAKDLNDSSPTNTHWARYSSVNGYKGFEFSVDEVNIMENQFLSWLDWDLRIINEDLFTHLEPFLRPIRTHLELNVSSVIIAFKSKTLSSNHELTILQPLVSHSTTSLPTPPYSVGVYT
jgi:G1/S-specific cyclin PLC1